MNNRVRTTKCRTRCSAQSGAVPVVDALEDLLGERPPERQVGRRTTPADAERRRPRAWGSSARGPRSLVSGCKAPTPAQKPLMGAQRRLATDAARLDRGLTEKLRSVHHGARECRSPGPCQAQERAAVRAVDRRPTRDGLVIDHTGRTFGGVERLRVPLVAKGRSGIHVLTRLADEKAYRRLAISNDTNWADIALRSDADPASPASPGCVEGPLPCLEQLERLGVGMDPRSAARASVYLRRRARRSHGTGTRPRRISPRPRNTRQSLNSPCVWPTSRQPRVATTSPRAATTSPRAATDFAKGGDGLRQGRRRLRSRLAVTTATRSAPHGARLQVAPHHRCLN